jgi:hypothetical protein
MSSTLGFWKGIVTTKLGDTGDAINQWYARHDPATASRVEIDQLGERANQLAHRIAEIQGDVEHDRHAVEGLTLKLTRDKQAAGVLGGRLKEMQTTAAGEGANATQATLQVTQLTAQLTAVLAEIEQLGGDDGSGTKSGQLLVAQQTLDTDRANLDQFREGHRRAINDWTTAEARLKQARASMEQAQQQQRAAQERAQQSARDSGLLHGSDSGHVALDAMTAAADKARVEAQAATIQADALRNARGDNVSDIVNDALTDPTTDKSSAALDRLARLTGG